MNPPQIQLEYAAPVKSRRPALRRVALILLLVLAGWVAVKHGEEILAAIHRRWVQARCSTFEYAEGTVIYDSDVARGAALLRDKPGDYVSLTDTAVWPMEAVVRQEPREWARLKQLMFKGRQFWPPGTPAPKAMLHRLRSPSGAERIVALIVAPDLPKNSASGQLSPGRPRHIQLVAAVVRPAVSYSDTPRWDGNSGFLRGGFESARRLRFFAAQIDPHSPARFSLRYEMDDAAGMIDGALEDDGSISLKVRDGPAKQREWYSEDGT